VQGIPEAQSDLDLGQPGVEEKKHTAKTVVVTRRASVAAVPTPAAKPATLATAVRRSSLSAVDDKAKSTSSAAVIGRSLHASAGKVPVDIINREMLGANHSALGGDSEGESGESGESDADTEEDVAKSPSSSMKKERSASMPPSAMAQVLSSSSKKAASSSKVVAAPQRRSTMGSTTKK